MDENEQLNQVLIDLTRSLLQYVGECFPWSAADASTEQETINQAVVRQKVHISRLADLLDLRQTTIDFGTYPTEYTSLHYLALEHLLSQLADSEQNLIQELEQSIQICGDDTAAVEILERALADEHENLTVLQELAQSHSAGSVV